jgi:hypothetical protein
VEACAPRSRLTRDPTRPPPHRTSHPTGPPTPLDPIPWCRAFWDYLPPEFQDRPPDIVAVQHFDKKRKMNWHTDSKPDARRPEQEVAQEQGSPFSGT